MEDKFHVSGEKPFTCDECGIKFAHSKTLVNHKKMKHSEVPVKEYYIIHTLFIYLTLAAKPPGGLFGGSAV